MENHEDDFEDEIHTTNTPGYKPPLKSIRLKCLDCCCGSINEVKECTATKCALFPYRFGKNPFRQRRELTEEERQVVVARLAKARESAK